MLFRSAAMGLAGLFAGDRIAGIVQEFIKKGGKGESITDAAMESRGALVDFLMENIKNHPLTGIGFGISSNPADWWRIARDPLFGIPTTASTEKGVMPLAIAEEAGIPIAILTFLFLGLLTLRSARGGIVPFTVFTVAMLTNIAEATFFSPGGQGMLILLVVTWSATEPPGGIWIGRRSVPIPGPIMA